MHVLFVFGASRSRGPPAEGEGQGWKWAFEPRQVTHPLPTTWCTGRCCCSGVGGVSTFYCLFWMGPNSPLLRKKMPGYMGCGGAMWASVSPMHHERVFSQLIRWSVASQNLASRLFLKHHAGPYRQRNTRGSGQWGLQVQVQVRPHKATHTNRPDKKY